MTTARRRGVAQLLVECGERRLAGRDGLPSEPSQQPCSQLSEIDDSGRDAVGVQGEPENVGQRFEQLGGGALGQHGESVGGADDAPVPVDEHGWVRLVAAEDELERVVYSTHLGVVEPALPVDGGVPAARSSWLRSRSGMSRVAARCSTISALGRDRPVSMKLMWPIT
jgi:hypothetical protein